MNALSSQVLKQFIYLDGFNYVLVLALHPATFFLFDTNKSEWICSIESHSQPAVSMVTTQNPFSIYTCSAEEGVLRLWNLHRLFPRYVTMKSNIPITPILVNKGPEVSLRRPSSRRQSRSSKIGSAKSSKSNKSVRFADEGTDDDASSIKSAASSRRELVTVATEDSLSTFLSDDPIDGEIKDFKEEMETMFGVTTAVFRYHLYKPYIYIFHFGNLFLTFTMGFSSMSIELLIMITYDNMIETSGTPLLTWINFIVWISNHKPSKLWDKITYPFPNLNGGTDEIREWKSNSISHFIMDAIVHPNLFMSG